MPYTFVTPTVSEGPAGQDERLWMFYKLDRGITVLRYGSEFVQVRFPTTDVLDEADEYWLGGTTSTVSNATAALLSAAGYDDYLTEIV